MKNICLKKSIFYIALSLFAQTEGQALNATFTLPVIPGTPKGTLTISAGPIGAGNEVIRNAINWMNTQRAGSPPALDLVYNAFARIPATGDAAAIVTEYNAYKSLNSALNGYNLAPVQIDLSTLSAAQYKDLAEDWLTNYASTSGSEITVKGSTMGDLWANGTFSSILKAASTNTTLKFDNCFISQVAPSNSSGASSASVPGGVTSMNLQSGICTKANIEFTDCYLGSSLIAFPAPVDGSVARQMVNVLGASAISGNNKITVTYKNWVGTSNNAASLTSLNTMGWDPVSYGDVNGTPMGNWADLGVFPDFSSAHPSIVLTLNNNAGSNNGHPLRLQVPDSVIVTNIQNTLKAQIAKDPFNPDLLEEARKHNIKVPPMKGEIALSKEKLPFIFNALKEREIIPHRLIVTNTQSAYNTDRRELYLPLEDVVKNWSKISEHALTALKDGLRASPDVSSSAFDTKSRANFLTSTPLNELDNTVRMVRVDESESAGIFIENGGIVVKFSKEELLEEGRKKALLPDGSALKSFIRVTKPWTQAEVNQACKDIKDATKKFEITPEWVR